MIEVLLCLVLFTACAMHVRIALESGKSPRPCPEQHLFLKPP
jgi:hypothetical protein